MALTRNRIKEILSTAGVDDDHMDAAITAILNGHTATVDALKEDRDSYKTAAEELPKVQKELKELQDAAGKEDPYKGKYESLKAEYDKYKTEQTAKETHAKKTDAYRSLLKEAGISDKHINTVLRASDVDSLQFGDDGKVVDSDKAIKSIKDEWSDLISTPGTQGAQVANPPGSNGTQKYHGTGRAVEIAQAFMQSRYGVKPQSEGNGGK